MPFARRRRHYGVAALSRFFLFALIPLVPLKGVAASERPANPVEPAALQSASSAEAHPAQDDPPPATCSSGEIVSARGRDLKLFRNEDCTYTALYGRYLHYQKAPGQWEEVDLNFRSEGTDFVMDRHDIEVRITGATLKATERASGKGIRWVLPMPPVVAGRSARFALGGLQWEYTTTKPGLKLAAVVPAPIGQRSWEFPYQLVGGAAALSVDEEGNLVSDIFSVPRPFVLGADGRIYQVSQWRLLPGSRVAFDFDDSTLPPEAFPYELDPTTSFSVAAGVDDTHLGRVAAVYPPPNVGKVTYSGTGTSIISPSRSVVETCQPSPESAGGAWGWAMALCPEYTIENALIRWDTSALPDTAVVTGATLRAYTSVNYNSDSRSLTADWYTAWPIDEADYSQDAWNSAISGRPLSSISGGETDFTLSNPGIYVSKTGYTGLRLHVSGGQPSNGRNQVDIRTLEHSSGPEPRLLVTYSTAPVVTTVSDTPDPVTAGDPVSFSASWTDSDPGDSVRAVICKTNQISVGGSCPGGYWGFGNLSTTSPSTASFTPTALHHGTQTYYAFACDAAGACSSSVSGTFVVQNRIPAISAASDSPDPVTVGNPLAFSVSWNDLGDSIRAVICKTNQVSAATCPGGAWAIGNPGGASPASVSIVPAVPDTGTHDYYAFACDASNACSPSVQGSLTVLNRRPMVLSVADSPDPVEAGKSLSFSVTWHDPGDSVRAVICRTDAIIEGSCSEGTWAIGGASGSGTSTATYLPTSSDKGMHSYFAFACDASNLCSSSMSGSFTTLPPAPNPNQIELNFEYADGTPMADATVAVYLNPYDPAPSYKPALLSNGTSLSDGSFSMSLGDTFSWTAPLGDTRINAVVLAVDGDKTVLVYQNLILPLYDQYQATLTPTFPAPSGLQSYSADEIVRLDTAVCIPAPDPDRLDSANGSVTVEDESGRPENPLECPQVPPGPEGAELTESDGSAAASLEDCYYENPPNDVICDKTWRWVKVVRHHVSRGMKGKFIFQTARETNTETAVSFGDGDAGWRVGGWMAEATYRGASRTKEVDGNFHRSRHARYRFYLWNRCGGTFFCWNSWEPHHWTWGLSRNNYEDSQPARNANYSINLKTDRLIRTSGRNETFAGGLSLAGLSLHSQAGYSENTKLVWDGQGRCNYNWLYGQNNDPGVAPTVFADSAECN